MDISIDEKRVYDASEGTTPVYVVGEFGVTRVNTSGDFVGEFGLSRRCAARDAAGRDGRIAVATAEDVLVGTADESDTEFEALGVGPAVAVGFTGDGESADPELLVARADGTVIRGDDSPSHEESWTELGGLDDVRGVDGDLVAAASGVYKATATGLQHVGLDDARDASATGVPLAATASGLYKLGNGWMDELDGDFRAVSAAPASAPAGARVDEKNARANGNASADALGWAHAASEDGLFAHENGEWREVRLPVDGEVVALDHASRRTVDEQNESGRREDEARQGTTRTDGAYAVTEEGTFLLSVGDGWNHQFLGLRGVRAVAAP